MVLLYMITFTINIPHMLAYITYMDPMGYMIYAMNLNLFHIVPRKRTLTMASLKNSGPLQKFARCYHRPKHGDGLRKRRLDRVNIAQQSNVPGTRVQIKYMGTPTISFPTEHVTFGTHLSWLVAGSLAVSTEPIPSLLFLKKDCHPIPVLVISCWFQPVSLLFAW